ncbi:MAG: response regulator [Oscillospiraceae bacterium]|nr:response regulator [Oscillospiraceae bacterium]
MKKKLLAALLALIFAAGVIFAGAEYFGFVSQTIYEESTAHLVEIFRQANMALSNLVSVNRSRMQMWTPYLENTESEADIIEYVAEAKEVNRFTDFYFISRNGEYLSIDGQRGYLNLRDKLPALILDDQPIVANSVVPDKPEIMVFAAPCELCSYKGFEYEAIAITFNNSDLVEALKISAFNGQASTYAVLPDGRVVVDNGSEDMEDIHNIFAFLERSERLSDEDISKLHTDFLAGNSGQMLFDVNGRKYYLVYESAGFQDWMVLGIVPTDIVNASMNKLQSATMAVVSVITIAFAVMLLMLVIQRNRQMLAEKDHELVARDELFSKLSINVDDVFMMINAEDHRVEYVSPNIEKLLGITEAEVRKDVYSLGRLVKEDEAAGVLDQLSDIIPGKQREWDREYIHQASGELRWFHVIAFCSDIRGAKKYILDLSDRTSDKKINQKLEEAVHTAQNASLAKTTFLNNMSHDIRTPMNAIMGFTGIALKQDPEPEVKSCLEKISKSSEHLLTLINDVLDISRIESGKMKFEPVPVDITSVNDMVANIVHGFLTDRNITFDTKAEVPETPYVLADSVRIREVLVNILGNAVKFTEDGGSITFETSYRQGCDDRHMNVCYRIADTGVGMSEEFVEHIFDEFSQEETGARTQYKGTGLGMAISKHYVDLMGGSILVESRKGAGSVFTVELPLEITDKSNVCEKAMPIANVDLNGVKILLAEDNDLNAEIAVIQLEELGIKVTRAADGKETVKLFEENPPEAFDMILMDIMMPEMNGYEATKAIRSMQGRPDARNIPIIALTANAFAEDVQASLDAGMNGHLAKPIVIQEVIGTIARQVHR